MEKKFKIVKDVADKIIKQIFFDELIQNQKCFAAYEKEKRIRSYISISKPKWDALVTLPRNMYQVQNESLFL